MGANCPGGICPGCFCPGGAGVQLSLDAAFICSTLNRCGVCNLSVYDV